MKRFWKKFKLGPDLVFFLNFGPDLVFIFLPLTMKSGRVRGQALLGMKPPLGLAHVKKRRDKKVLEKHKLH